MYASSNLFPSGAHASVGSTASLATIPRQDGRLRRLRRLRDAVSASGGLFALHAI